MKKALTYLIAIWACVPVLAQPNRKLTEEPPYEHRYILGIDLGKTLAAAVGGEGADYPLKSDLFFTIEPTLRVESANERLFWVIQPGLTRFTGAPFGNVRLTMTGSFLKIGAEYRLSPVDGVALLATTSGWQTRGDFTIPGTPFGNYQATIPQRTGWAAGLEIQLTHDIRLAPTSLFRFVFRGNNFWRNRMTGGLETPYIPGIGRYFDLRNSPLSFTMGLGLEYHHYLRGRH